MTMARVGEPESRIAAVNPEAIDSTDTSTMTTPAIPTMATPDEPRRCGIVRKLRAVTASIWLITIVLSGRPEGRPHNS